LARRHQRHELRLQIGRESREWRCRHVDRLDAGAVARDADAVIGRRDLAPASTSTSSADCSSSGRAPRAHVAAGHRHGHGIGAGLDAVRQHGVARAIQLGDAVDGDRRVPAPEILAPILFRQSARSTISGSHAALSMTVVPLASTQPSALHGCRRPVTFGKTISAPFRPPGPWR
jgi:hypothetical protein